MRLTWANSSVRLSARLITGRSAVQIRVGPSVLRRTDVRSEQSIQADLSPASRSPRAKRVGTSGFGSNPRWPTSRKFYNSYRACSRPPAGTSLGQVDRFHDRPKLCRLVLTTTSISADIKTMVCNVKFFCIVRFSLRVASSPHPPLPPPLSKAMAPTPGSHQEFGGRASLRLRQGTVTQYSRALPPTPIGVGFRTVPL